MSSTVKVHRSKIKIPGIRASSRMDPEAKEFFDATIKEVGVVQEPVVRSLDDGTYELVAGLSRMRAQIEDGAQEIEVKVIQVDERTATVMHLAENVARGKVDPISIAKVMTKLMGQGYNIQDLRRALGKSESWVRRTLQLLDLPEEIQQAIAQGLLTPSHVYIAAHMPTPDETLDALQTAVKLGWTSSTLETFVANRLSEIDAAKKAAEEKGGPVDIPPANPQQLISFKQCLLCGYRKPQDKVLNMMVCEDCINLVKYVTGQLGPSDQALNTLYSALAKYFGQTIPATPPANIPTTESASQ